MNSAIQQLPDPFFQFKELDFTHIGIHTNLKGIFTFQGYVRVSGNIEGEIIMKEGVLTIDPLGVIKGSIQVQSLIIFGTFLGDIKCDGPVELKSTAHCTGTIVSKNLKIHAGAICNFMANNLQ